MTHLLERLRPRKKMYRADILSDFGETICRPDIRDLAPAPARPITPIRIQLPTPDSAPWHEDPERWDGLS